MRLFTLTIAVLLAFAASATAQTETYDQPIPSKRILGVLATNADIVGVEQIPTSVTFTGELDYTDVRRAINYVLANSSDSRWEAIDVDGKIVIRRRGAAPVSRQSAASGRAGDQAASQSPFRDGVIQEPPPGCPTVADTDPEARPDSRDPFKRMEYWRAVGNECLRRQQAAAENELFQAAHMRSIQMQGWGGYQPATYGTYGGPGSYGYGYQEYLNPFAIRDHNNAEKYGLLKIDGPDRFLRQVRVVIDGRDMAVASKANNAWNKPVLLTAGPHVVEFVHEGPGGIVAFRREVEISSISVQRMAFGKNEPTWLRVSGNEFTHAREIYQYRQRVFVEK